MRLVIRLCLAASLAGSLWAAILILPTAASIDRERRLALALVGAATLQVSDVAAVHSDAIARLDLNACPMEGWGPMVAMAAWMADSHHLQADQATLDRRIEMALAAARQSIRCAPLDPLAWLALARFEMLREGVSERTLQYVRFTRAIAPREGWVRWQRAAMLLPLRRWLEPSDLAALIDDLAALVEGEDAVDDVVRLVRTADRQFQIDLSKRIASLSGARQRLYQRKAVEAMIDVSGLAIAPSARDAVSTPRTWMPELR
jgi:hypothetical protein